MCEVPQRSPVSPLLFILYMAEPMRSGNVITRFSYADDIKILGFRRTAVDFVAAAQREVDNLASWAHENSVLFDAGKLEVVQFLGRKKEDPVGVLVSGRKIQPAERIRWLGVYLDSGLSFKHHMSTGVLKLSS